MQMQGNLYHAFVHMGDFTQWSELFDLIEEDPLFQKRVLAGVAAGILPLVALGFIKSLVDYIKPGETEELKEDINDILEDEDYNSKEDEEAWEEELEEIENEEKFKEIEWEEDEDEEEWEEDEEDDSPPWYEEGEEREDLLDIATEKKNKEKRDSFLND